MIELGTLPYLVKICGVTSVEDAWGVHARGASALGLILAPSKRQVSIAQASRISDATRGMLWRVGVFRHDPVEFITEALDATGVEAAQIHGHLSDELLAELRQRDVAVIKALALGEDEFLEFDETTVDAVLVDGPTPGTGESHSWAEVASRHFRVPVIAAGGLNPSNVAEVITTVHPWGVDVATGVESRPGVKDLTLVGRFVELARDAFMQREE